MSVKKLGNAGMSLVELLVALAASSLVIVAVMALMINGMNSYRKQTVSAQLQEDANITLNQMSDTIMEATMVEVSNSESANGNTKEFQTAEHMKYRYDEDEKILYVTTVDDDTGASIDSVLCTNVTKFRVQILSSSVNIEKDETSTERVKGINNPVQIKVTLEVERDRVTRNISRISAVRNRVKEIKLHFFDAEEFPDVGVLKSYGFLTDW